MMGELWLRMIDGETRWEQYGGYEEMWKIRGTICSIGMRIPCIGDITCRIMSISTVSGMVNCLP